MLAFGQLARIADPDFNGTPYPDAPDAPDFALVDHTGETTRLSDFEGKAIFLFFGFTRCPDVCPLTLAKLSRLLEAEGLSPEQVRILLVTVDPEHDTPERLATYLSGFGPWVTGLTGDEDTIRGILADYGVHATPTHGSHGETAIAHTTQVFGIDRAGRLRVLMHPEERDEIVTADIRALVRIRS